MYTKKFEDALLYAAHVHEGQIRKGSNIPYITHLLSVCAIVGENGGTEDEVISALLHDAIEDTNATRDTIENRFGEEVARTVLACSDADVPFGVEKPPWRKRKETYLEGIALKPVSARLVSSADKLHNARAILTDYRAVGESVWSRFTGGRDGTLWYYRSLVAAFRKADDGTDKRLRPVIAELSRTVEELHEAAGEPSAGGDS